jgi:hypothetical protein
MLEKVVLADMRAAIFLYRRFLDDVFAVVEPAAVPAFMQRMNTLHPKLKFEFATDTTEAAFLDLRIHKGKRFETSGIFDLSLHQKKMNLYLYIPFRSFHTDAMKRSFIQTELMRYIRNSSDYVEYAQLKHVFYQRLRDRGYPEPFLQPIFRSIFYADRHYFLWPSALLPQHPKLLSDPSRSACLLRRLHRWRIARDAAAAHTTDAPSPPVSDAPLVFVVPNSPLTRVLAPRKILSQQWSLVQEALDEPALRPPIMAYQSAPNLVKLLVYQRARQLEERRREDQQQQHAISAPAAGAKQLQLQRFLVPIVRA